MGCETMHLREEWVLPGGELSDAFMVRKIVFVDEQGFAPELDVDDIDATARHIILYDGPRPVACARLFEDSETPGAYIAGRICVLKELRGYHIGERLMVRLEETARELGAREMLLGAQEQAQGFYARCGYIPFGEMYMEEHCRHVHMRKTL